MLKKLKIKPIYRRRFYFIQHLIDVELKQYFISFDLYFLSLFTRCANKKRSADARQFKTIVNILKQKCQLAPQEREKSSARLEFVGILKQELKNILSLFLLQNSTIL